MRTADFNFELPDELIARYPTNPRDSARLLVVDRMSQTWRHHAFSDLPDLLDPRDILVRNNTRVVPARLIGRRASTGGKWEGLFLHELPNGRWRILATTRGRPQIGETIVIGEGLHLILEARADDGSWVVSPQSASDEPWTTMALLERHGQTPLPPYIRGGHANAADLLDYQTIYAREPGSAAAPTAGLHFTEALFQKLATRGITWVDLTLSIGVGTFRPIQVDRIEDHVMHAEWTHVTASAVDQITTQRRLGGRVIAVGTTSTRALETAASTGTLQPFSGETSLFIRPGHVFHAVDGLITNFHLPHSSLLVLVSAFAGYELIKSAYTEAIRERYRFFSYGDAMLIL